MSDPVQHTSALEAAPANPVALKLVVASGPDAGRTLVLEKGTYRVGKGADCDLTLTDPAVSRVHLEVEVLPAGARVLDKGSRNGSFFQGSRFERLDLRPGALVRIGTTDLKLVPLRTPDAQGPSLSAADRFGLLVGHSQPMRSLFATLERLAASDSDVLVQGETGTGKELCAESIHRASARAKGPFVVCDLAAVAPTLFESELFGHVRGAFTGAVSDRPGAFEQAHGGTLFLDEVGELPLEIQPRLLRALERREVKRLGSNNYKKVDVRVVSATHRDLAARAREGTFREDLYHRLAVTTVRLPALRERPDDLPLLIDELLTRLGRPAHILSAQTRALLQSYGWPGNVRELRNVVERVVSLGPAGLPEIEAPAAAEAPVAERPSGDRPARLGLPFKEAKEHLVTAFERDYLSDLLQRCGGNIRGASREAGIDRVYLKKLLRKHGLRAGDDEPDER